jgi:AcrR family transcriptional regulator
VQTAARLFSSQGYAATSMQDIMSAVGISGAAYYYYFSSKEDVLLEILEQEMERVESSLESLTHDPTLSAGDRLARTLADHAQTIAEHAQTSSVLFNELNNLSGPATRPIRSRMRHYTEALIELYRQGVAAGEFAPLDASVAVNSMLGMCNWVHHWFDPRVHSAEEVGRSIGELAAHGFAAPGDPGSAT